MYTSAARLEQLHLMGWIYCLVPKLATKTVCPRFLTVCGNILETPCYTLLRNFSVCISEQRNHIIPCYETTKPGPHAHIMNIMNNVIIFVKESFALTVTHHTQRNFADMFWELR